MFWQILLIAAAIAFVALIAKSVLNGFRRSRSAKMKAASLMKDRNSLTARQFASKYFPDQTDAAICVYDILVNNLIVDVTRIEPTDRLYQDLALGAVDALAPAHFAVDIDEAFGLDPTKLLECNSTTVKDIVAFVHHGTRNAG